MMNRRRRTRRRFAASRHLAEASYGAKQNMLLAAERQLDGAAGPKRVAAERRALVGDRDIVDLETAAANLAARFAGRRDETNLNEGGENAEPSFKICCGRLERRKAFGDFAFFESAPCGFGGARGRCFAVEQARRLIGQRLLGFVDLGAGQCLELA